MKEHGAIIVDGMQVASTHQCCHCGQHFVSVKGSGKVRGFCIKCMRSTCGSIKCHNCMPLEKQLNIMEKII